MGRVNRRNENHHNGGTQADYMTGPTTRMNSRERGMEFSEKEGAIGRPRAGAHENHLEGDKANSRVVGSWIQITNVGRIKCTAADQWYHKN